jgi:hypothetical protein
MPTLAGLRAALNGLLHVDRSELRRAFSPMEEKAGRATPSVQSLCETMTLVDHS